MSETRQAETSGFPIFLHLAGRRVLVVGGDDEAAAQVQLMLPTRPIVVVVASVPCDALSRLEAEGRLELHRRPFLPLDLEGVRLCVVAMPDAEAAVAIAAEADANRVPVNVIGRPDLSTFSAATVDCGATTVAISQDWTALSPAHHVRGNVELAVPQGPVAMGASRGDRRGTTAAASPDAATSHRCRDAAIGEPEVREALDCARLERGHLRAARRVSVNRANPAGRASLVGAGPGDPELLTLRAARALTEADVVLYDALIDPAVLNLARRDARRIDVGKRCGRHAMSQAAINGCATTGIVRDAIYATMVPPA